MTTTLIKAQSAPVGKALAVACPICGGTPRYRLDTRTLTCAGCNLAVTLGPAEHKDLVWYLAAPGLSDVPLDLFLRAVLAAHNLHGALKTPDPRVISARDAQGWKWRVLPEAGETPAARLARLSEQAVLNGVQVRPLNIMLTEWEATSQRRDADGKPVRTYRVRISALGARCECATPNDELCAHLSAVHSALLDLRAEEPPPVDEPEEVAWNSWRREAKTPKAPAQVMADGQAAEALLFG